MFMIVVSLRTSAYDATHCPRSEDSVFDLYIRMAWPFGYDAIVLHGSSRATSFLQPPRCQSSCETGLPMTDGVFTSLNRDEIQTLIPHRPPFLWLDEVVELHETSLRAKTFINPQLDVFQGHYPAFPVLPGVIQCEAAFQAGAVLIARHFPPVAGQVPVVTRLNNVQFRRMVTPGQMLEIDVELMEKMANAYFLKAKVSVAGQVTVRLEFACALAQPENA